MNADKRWILEGTGPEHREGLKRVPGAYFQVARETVDDPDDREAVLERLLDLYGLCVEKIEARADRLEAEIAERRRAHLRLVPDDPGQSGRVQELPIHSSSEGGTA